MEIHPIHGPVQSWREFFTHLAIITIGILIALSLEGLLEWGHHRELVRQARENILTEVRKNKDTVDHALPELKKRQDELSNIIAISRQLETNPAAFKTGTLTFAWSSEDLYSTAWKTASVSGAVTYMNYDELARYTDAYDGQQDYASLTQEGFRALADLAPEIQTTMAEKDFKKVPRDRFVQMERAAYRELTIAQGLQNLCQDLRNKYEAILKQQ